MRCVCYMATRSWYDRVVPSIKSLLAHTDVDKIYLLIEDDEFPYHLPKIHPINVKHQEYLKKDSPNMLGNRWGYMTMMKACLHRILDEDKVLAIDADTIIQDDISELWDIDLDGYYVAGVREPEKSIGGVFEFSNVYINAGVMMMNLAELRKGRGDEIIQSLNNMHYTFLEQDCINRYCQGKILELPSTYNSTKFTAPVPRAKIIHFAAQRNWFTFPLVEYYRGYVL